MFKKVFEGKRNAMSYSKYASILLVMATVVVVSTGCGEAAQSPNIGLSDQQEKDEQINVMQENQTQAEEEIAPQNIQEVLNSWNFEQGAILLPEVLEALEKNKIQYTGYYYYSERLDITLEDGSTLLFLKATDSDGTELGYELIMKNEEFNANGFQEDYLNAYDVISDEYFYPDLSERLWTEDELLGLDDTRLSIARNQIFAKYGRRFEDSFLHEVFSQKNWYEPKYSAEEFAVTQQKLLTETEQANLQTVIQHEILLGMRNEPGDESERIKRLLDGSWLDLNGDGEKEQIFYVIEEVLERKYWSEITEVSLVVKNSVGEEVCRIKKHGPNLVENCYTMSPDGVQQLLMIYNNGESADPMAEFYRYEDGKLEEAGVILCYPGGFRVYPGRLLAKEETYHLQCQPVEFEFLWQDGMWVKQEKEYYEYRQNVVTALQEFYLYEEKNSTDAAIVIPEGTGVQVMGGDLKEWVLLKNVDTGESGWLKVEGGECLLSDGSEIYSEKLLDGVTIYG